jgi:hypothetical protein
MNTNKINQMSINSNNLNKLNKIDSSYGRRSLTDPSSEDYYYNHKYPSFFTSHSDIDQTASRQFPFIEDNQRNYLSNNNEDSFDYSNINEE